MTQLKGKQAPYLPSVWTDFFDTDKFFGKRWFEGEFEQTLPAVNVKENEREFKIELAAPGFEKKDFKIEVDGNNISIFAEKQDENKENNEKFTRKEFSYRSFSRAFTLPLNTNSERIEAGYENGILNLSVPKKEISSANSRKEIKIA